MTIINVATGKPLAEFDPETAYEQNVENWLRVSDGVRRRVLNHLRTSIIAMDHQDLLDRWRDQVAQGIEVGSDSPGFHFSGGMAIRNMCRQVMSDDELPPVRQPFGEMSSNWDDYYIGALVELSQDAASAVPQEDTAESESNVTGLLVVILIAVTLLAAIVVYVR